MVAKNKNVKSAKKPSRKKSSWIVDKWDEPKGRTLSVEVTKHLASKKTKFQQIDFYETKAFGNILVLDGVINTTEFDEFSYQEMIAHVPMFSHGNPKRVLIIGGGDGGVAREILKHNIESVDLCEIDRDVIEMSKKYLPTVASAYGNPKLNVFCEDGSKFIKERKDTYDVIVVDSSDPWGPAESLFKREFYSDLYSALKKDGVIAFQSESMFYDRDTIKRLVDMNKEFYKIVEYYYAMVPTYPSGQIGFTICSKRWDPKKDIRKCPISGLKYYSTEVHRASFVLPEFFRRDFK